MSASQGGVGNGGSGSPLVSSRARGSSQGPGIEQLEAVQQQQQQQMWVLRPPLLPHYPQWRQPRLHQEVIPAAAADHDDSASPGLTHPCNIRQWRPQWQAGAASQT